MLIRGDDISVETDANKLKEISDCFNELQTQEVLAIVPFGKVIRPIEVELEVNKFNENGLLVKYLKDRIESGTEVALHGWEHINITEPELEDAIWEIIKARDYIEKLLEVKVKYFVPPFHIINKDLKYWLESLGFEILAGEGEDLDKLAKKYQSFKKETTMLWYHWWETDIEELKKWIKKYLWL